MATNSSIEWTDATWTVTTGCTEASSGCANCYARRMSKRQRAMAAADVVAGRNPGKKRHYELSVLDDGRWSGVVTTMPDALTEPLRWKKPRRIFVNSMSDLFWGTEKDLADARRRGVKDPQPVPFDFIDRVFAVMALTPHHTYQVLTKRPERMAEYFAGVDTLNATRLEDIQGMMQTEVIDLQRGERRAPADWDDVIDTTTLPLPNVHLGTSVENQQAADERSEHLRRCPAAVRFYSAEPLIGHINHLPLDGISWVIVGGESGPNARPFYTNWADDILAQCRAAGVPCFVKQLGSNVRHIDDEFGDVPIKLNDRKGGDMSEWPQDLRVREFPRREGVARA